MTRKRWPAIRSCPVGWQRCCATVLSCRWRRNAVSEGVQLSVQIRTRRAGHRVPTGFIDRHLLLVVEGYDGQGTKLAALDGPRLPAAADDLAGESGQLFAKMLVDQQGHGPLPFWQPAAAVQDTRLGPEELRIHTFRYPPGTARFRVRLIHRRFWRAVARQKNWPDDQIIVRKTGCSYPKPRSPVHAKPGHPTVAGTERRDTPEPSVNTQPGIAAPAGHGGEGLRVVRCQKNLLRWRRGLTERSSPAGLPRHEPVMMGARVYHRGRVVRGC